MTIPCPHCQAELDIAGKRPGDRVLHTRCGYWLLVARRGDGSRYGVKVSGPKVYKQIQRSE